MQPPTVVLFTNGPELFDNTYRRYLLKYLRDRTPFTDVPIKLLLRNKHREGERDLEEGPAEEAAPAAAEGRKRRRGAEEGADRGGGAGDSELWDV